VKVRAVGAAVTVAGVVMVRLTGMLNRVPPLGEIMTLP